MASNPPSPNQPTQFSTRGLLAVVTFVALLVGVLSIGYQASKAKRQLRSEISGLRQENDELKVDLRNAIGGQLRTRYAEKLLFHVVANFEKYPKLEQRLTNYEQRKIGISVHALDDDDNLTYVNFYTMDGNVTSKPFCHSFLVQDEPFRVLADITGEQSRIPRLHEGKWVCGAGLDGKDRWFMIETQGFVNYQ